MVIDSSPSQKHSLASLIDKRQHTIHFDTLFSSLSLPTCVVDVDVGVGWADQDLLFSQFFSKIFDIKDDDDENFYLLIHS